MKQLTPEQVRSEFPVFDQLVFLNWAEAAPAPKCSVDSMRDYLDETLTLTGRELHLRWDKIADDARLQITALLSAGPTEVALTGSSTTQGIQIAFNTVSPLRGQNIVTCDLEFMMGGVELMKWAARGVEIRVWKHKNGSYDTEDLVSLIDENTRVLFLDSVIWINGYKFDINEVSKIAHEKGALLILDGMQQIGALEVNMSKTQVDFMAAGSHKWLMAPFGVGFLYVNRKVVETFQAPDQGYANTDIPGGRGNYFKRIDAATVTTYPMVETAKKFEYGGVHSAVALVGFGRSLEMINSVGPQKIEERIMALRKTLCDELERLGGRILSPQAVGRLSSIVLFSTGRGLQHDYQCVERLAASGVAISGRASSGIGGLRISLHYPNSESDILRLSEELFKLY